MGSRVIAEGMLRNQLARQRDRAMNRQIGSGNGIQVARTAPVLVSFSFFRTEVRCGFRAVTMQILRFAMLNDRA